MEEWGVSGNSSYSIFRVFSVSFSCFEVVREGSAVHESIRLMICYESVLMVQSRLDWIEYMRFSEASGKVSGGSALVVVIAFCDKNRISPAPEFVVI